LIPAGFSVKPTGFHLFPFDDEFISKKVLNLILLSAQSSCASKKELGIGKNPVLFLVSLVIPSQVPNIATGYEPVCSA